MNRIRSAYKAAVLAGLAALLAATSAFAALPTKGGLYEWKKTNSASLSLVSWIKLQVRADGKSA